jgi:hypothetical protein
VNGKTGNVAPVSGTVLVRLPHTKTFVPLTSLKHIPVGSELDTIHGRVRLTTSAGGKKTQTADFYQGRFIFTQKKAKKPITLLALRAFVLPEEAPAERRRRRSAILGLGRASPQQGQERLGYRARHHLADPGHLHDDARSRQARRGRRSTSSAQARAGQGRPHATIAHR